MTYFILALAIASLLLVGCGFGGTLEERQERAERILQDTAANLTGGVEEAKRIQEEIKENIINTSQKISETTAEFKERAEALQKGIEKIADAVESGQEGIDAVRGALNVSGEEEEEVETQK